MVPTPRSRWTATCAVGCAEPATDSPMAEPLTRTGRPRVRSAATATCSLELPMTAPAGRTGLFPIGPTTPLHFDSGSPERSSIRAALAEVRATSWEVASVIDGQEVRTGRTMPIVTAHAHPRELGQLPLAGIDQVQAAIDAAAKASRWWGSLPWEERAAPFLRAADMLQ